MSYIEKKSVIKHFSKLCPEFFGYSLLQFEKITSLNYIMPNKFGIHHDELVARVIEEGVPKILSQYRELYAVD
jgi:hypothetical protein